MSDKRHDLSENEIRLNCLMAAVHSEAKTFSIKEDDTGELLDARIVQRTEAFYQWFVKDRSQKKGKGDIEEKPEPTIAKPEGIGPS
jgi:hypothetical protein